MIEFKRNSSGHQNFKTIDSIIMRFPELKEGLKTIKYVFDQYGRYDEAAFYVLSNVIISIN